MNRRRLMQTAMGAAAAALAPGGRAGGSSADEPPRLFLFEKASSTPVKIASLDVLEAAGEHFVRAVSADGATGLAIANERIAYLLPILQQLVIPYFVGRDARDLERLVDGVYVHKSNYKLAGLALWNAVGWVEFALLDLLGRVANRSVGDLLGGVVRREVPIYLSSLRRDTTPDAEVDWLGRRLAETGAQAVKLKVGGRMSRNADAAPGRTDRLVPLARRTFGDRVTIYVDANGSYDAAKGIEVGRFLEAHRVAFFEEPCPFEELEETKRVADALEMPVAGGEQDASLPRFRWMIAHRVVDVVQPDVNYNGGFVRTARVARMAAEAGLTITPHSPKTGLGAVYVLHFASVTRNAGPHMEYHGSPPKAQPWCAPSPDVKDGRIRVPDGPGLGMTVDPALLAKARRL